MQRNVWLYLLVMFAVVYAVRVLPLTLFRKRITNRFLRSFLYYVPYVTLAVMTFPAILDATQSPLAGAAARCMAGERLKDIGHQSSDFQEHRKSEVRSREIQEGLSPSN